MCGLARRLENKAKQKLRDPGIEPGSVPWQGTILPLNQPRFMRHVIMTEQKKMATVNFCRSRGRSCLKIRKIKIACRSGSKGLKAAVKILLLRGHMSAYTVI